uniref:Uncharacterized protein n=1 Tax=Arundo donax TaxID=35708 RepID=A0A0A9ESC1_ARUDO
MVFAVSMVQCCLTQSFAAWKIHSTV